MVKTLNRQAAAAAECRVVPRPLDADTQVFQTENGTTPTKSNLRRALAALCKQAEVPFINVHGLRHVHAALLLREGIDPQALRRRLGHSHVSMTLDRYAYASPHFKVEYVDPNERPELLAKFEIVPEKLGSGLVHIAFKGEKVEEPSDVRPARPA